MTIFITGGCGFLGSNLAEESLRKGHKVIVYDNLSRTGAEQNLKWLQKQPNAGSLKFVKGDTRNQDELFTAFKTAMPEVVFHLAGQVAMTTSIANPRLDFETNVVGGFNVLEAVRTMSPKTTIIYSSTNKVYGDLENIEYKEESLRYTTPAFPRGFDESLGLNFCSPYGCSKGAVDQYMADYARIFGLKTIVFRHSSIYGGRQFATYDQGWIGWFVAKALEQKTVATPFTISGNGKQVRDALFAADIVRCYFAALDKADTIAGRAYNIGGGMENSLSLLELFAFLEKELNVTMKYEKLPVRASDQKVFVADNGAAARDFGWKPQISAAEGLRKMIQWTGEISGS